MFSTIICAFVLAGYLDQADPAKIVTQPERSSLKSSAAGKSSSPRGGVTVSSTPCGPTSRGGFRSIQATVDSRGCNISGDAANEPSIVIDPTEPRRIAIGWRQFNSVTSDFREASWAYSHDGGHT